MAVTVPRPKLNWRERLYLPAIVSGLAITFKHFKNMLLGHTKVTMQYPEQKWDNHLPDHYRGAPALVRDADLRRSGAGACLLPAPLGTAARPAGDLHREQVGRHVSHDMRLERLVDAQPEVAFDSFVDPEAQHQLYAEEPDWVVESECDLRIGGHWTISFGPPDARRWREANVFREIIRPRRLGYSSTMTRPDGSSVRKALKSAKVSTCSALLPKLISRTCLPIW